ncbi:MAG: helix-turn-helix domain-containing protein [Oscillospiraceae bacterium]|nr:helix-turn-helix domain-containing protein [Oscillospiraceae bacterium]
MDLMTVSEAAKLWNITPRRVQVMCENGQIKGAEKLGFMWTLPKTANKPVDGRTKLAKNQANILDGDINNV